MHSSQAPSIVAVHHSTSPEPRHPPLPPHGAPPISTRIQSTRVAGMLAAAAHARSQRHACPRSPFISGRRPLGAVQRGAGARGDVKRGVELLRRLEARRGGRITALGWGGVWWLLRSRRTGGVAGRGSGRPRATAKKDGVSGSDLVFVDQMCVGGICLTRG